MIRAYPVFSVRPKLRQSRANLESPIPSNPVPDHELDGPLIARARAGDGDALDELVVRYQDRVFNMAYRILGNREDALDTSQEIFITVFRTLHRFEERARFSTWLYRVTVNRCRDELRRRATRKHARPRSLDAARAAHEENGGQADPPQMAIAGEASARIQAAIDGLPDDTREVMVLRDVEDCSYEEIAEILAIPVGTVRSRLHRARSLMRDALQPMLEGEA